MITYYIIPKNVNYVEQSSDIFTWEKVNKVDPNISIVAVIDDSKYCKRLKFVVIYKNKMQRPGGSGSCYNPIKPTFIYKMDPMNNDTMPKHMSKWESYSYNKLLQLVISVKYSILESMGYKKYDENSNIDVNNRLPFWYWDCEYYNTLPGILIGLLDLVGINKIPASFIKENKSKKQLLLS